MLLCAFLVGFIYLVNAESNDSVIYNSYTGEPATQEELDAFKAAGVTGTCTNEVKTCDPDGWRPVDGSCNNLDYPDRGMFCTTQLRLLDADFRIDNGTYQPRLTKAGNKYGLARETRQSLLAVGHTVSPNMTQCGAHFAEFAFGDIGDVHDIFNFINTVTWCCEERGKTDSRCAPNYVLPTDNVHRFSNIRCLNMTTPMSFQNQGCTSDNNIPTRVDFSTSLWDLSNVYYYSEGVNELTRNGTSGLLKTELYDGKEFPSSANESTTCMLEDAIKTGCTRRVPNGLIGTNLFTLLYWRNHNLIARTLAELNPCWTDDQLFYTARDINIACHTQSLYYEFMPILLGRQRMINEGIITEDQCARDVYDCEQTPQMAMESSYILRYFHTTVVGMQEEYDANDTLVGKTSITRFNRKVQDLAVDNELALITHGMHIQPCGGFDQVVDTELAENATGWLQRASDVTTNDLAKSGLFGITSYIKYCDLCYNNTHESWEDLEYLMSEAKIDLLKEIYADVSDIELLVGAWFEDPAEEGLAPPIVTCLLLNQLKRSLVTDRYWYERPNKPYAFTTDQLAQIRNYSIARLLCNVGEVPRVQPQAFLTIGPDNEMVSCDEIPDIDYTLWIDETCSSDCEEDV